jgi:rod shape-determining protein MreC
MAPPHQRRSSYSKKAQYSVFTGYLLAVLGALVGIGLLIVSIWQPASVAPLRGAANDAVAPVGEGAAAARSSSNSVWDTLSGYWQAGSQNATLRKEVEIARIRLAEAEAIKRENARLKSLLRLSESEGEMKPVAVARLIASSATSSRRFAYIGAGQGSGVKVGMPVRSPRGIVGRVLEVGSTSSRILLLTDSESRLPVRRAKDSTPAFAEGRGDGLVRIRLINLGINPLKKGDVFVTSGAGGFYRPGVAVAIVHEVTDDGANARLIADPSATDFVAVEPIYQPIAVKAAASRDDRPLGDQPDRPER